VAARLSNEYDVTHRHLLEESNARDTWLQRRSSSLTAHFNSEVCDILTSSSFLLHRIKGTFIVLMTLIPTGTFGTWVCVPTKFSKKWKKKSYLKVSKKFEINFCTNILCWYLCKFSRKNTIVCSLHENNKMSKWHNNVWIRIIHRNRNFHFFHFLCRSHTIFFRENLHE
jgi:hypothetical protein